MTLPKTLLAAIVKSLLRGKSLIQAILNYWITPLTVKTTTKPRVTRSKKSSIQDFIKEAETAFLGPISGDGLSDLSAALRKQFRARLQTDLECMLPSYSHKLPTGDEKGQYLALDVGGSTLRVALVQLRGRSAETKRQSEILESRSFKIDKPIKDLEGMAFFEWMASRINDTLSGGLKKEYDPEHPLHMALAWSFPIE
jgi:hexokinase